MKEEQIIYNDFRPNMNYENLNNSKKDKLNQNFLLLEARESHKISLRKKKMNEILSTKRNFKQLSKSKFEPYINENEIPLSLSPKTQNEIELLNFYLSSLSQYFPKQLNCFFYILKQITKTLSMISNDKIISTIAELGIIDKLHVYLMNNVTNNKIVIYQIILIFMKISLIPNETLMEKFINILDLQLYIDIITQLSENIESNREILATFIIFLGNLVDNSEYIKYTFYKYKIFDVIQDLLDYENIDAENNLNKEAIGFFVRFAAVKKYIDDDNIKELYSIFSYYFLNSHSNNDILKDSLWGLSFLSLYTQCQSILSLYISENIISSMLSIKDSSFFIPITRTLGNITSLSDSNCSLVYTRECAEFLKNNLEYGTLQLKIETLWVINNIALGTNMKCLFQYGLLEHIIKCLESKRESAKVEIEMLKLIAICINNTDQPRLIVNNEVVNAILSLAGSNNKSEEEVTCMIVIFDSAMKYGDNQVVDKIIKSGLRDVIEKWCVVIGEETRNEAIKLIEQINMRDTNNQ